MKHKLLISAALAVVSFKCHALNPLVQTIYTADPAPMVCKDTLYLYTGHDEDGSTQYVMKDWRCYSTTDMVNWTDHGSPLSLKDFSWVKSDAWAGQCIERNGKFYYYVPMIQTNGVGAIGVAVADSPTGPFHDALGHRLVTTGKGDIDPTVFIDDDGQAYMYWGNPHLFYVKLNQDMISFDTTIGDMGVVDVPLTVESFGRGNGRSWCPRDTLYEEGPWFYKRNGLYYMVYAASGLPENICYATGTNATGPWAFKGVIIPTQGGSSTDHPGIMDYKGHSYFFYHNDALPGGGSYTRSVCVEEFKYNADGTFPTINMTTNGPAPVGHLNPFVRTEAETMAWESGVKTEPCSQGGMEVCEIDDGDYIRVRSVDFGTAGAAAFAACVSSDTCAGAGSSSAIELRLDGLDGTLIGTLPVSYTGGWNNWKIQQTSISGAAGIHDLYFVFKGQDKHDLFKMDYWQFTQKQAPARLVAINAAVDRYKIDALKGRNRGSVTVWAIYSDGTRKDVTAQAKIVPQQAGVVNCNRGILIGVASGATTLNVSYEDKTDAVQMIVKDLKSELIAKKITADVTSLKLLNGGAHPLAVTAEYFDGHTVDVTKTADYSADPAIAAIQEGVISAKRKGTTSVKISFKGETGDPVMAQINLDVVNRDAFASNQAADFSEQHGIQTEDSTEGGKNVGFIENGDWIKFSSVDFGAGATSFETRVASPTRGGNIEIHLDNLSGPAVGTCAVESTGGWQNWATKTCTVNGVQGTHDLYLEFIGGDGFIFNVNSWKFDKQ